MSRTQIELIDELGSTVVHARGVIDVLDSDAAIPIEVSVVEVKDEDDDGLPNNEDDVNALGESVERRSAQPWDTTLELLSDSVSDVLLEMLLVDAETIHANSDDVVKGDDSGMDSVLGLDDVDNKLADVVCVGDASLSVDEDVALSVDGNDGADELVLWADELDIADDSCVAPGDTETSAESKPPRPELEGIVLVGVADNDVEPNSQAKISSREDNKDAVEDDDTTEDDDDTVDDNDDDGDTAEDNDDDDDTAEDNDDDDDTAEDNDDVGDTVDAVEDDDTAEDNDDDDDTAGDNEDDGKVEDDNGDDDTAEDIDDVGDTVDDIDVDDNVDDSDSNGAEDVEAEDVVDVDLCFGGVIVRTTDRGVTDAVSTSPNSVIIGISVVRVWDTSGIDSNNNMWLVVVAREIALSEDEADTWASFLLCS
ncbi:hypothetical protein IW147_000373 [Coemansia sp. RSA 720]|nr:hypothetical protein IW147_000373 [Coemansia sp. RSA 720]